MHHVHLRRAFGGEQDEVGTGQWGHMTESRLPNEAQGRRGWRFGNTLSRPSRPCQSWTKLLCRAYGLALQQVCSLVVPIARPYDVK